MKTTLINCGVRTSTERDGARVPQGCLYLLAATRDAGFHVEFRDYQMHKAKDLLNPSNLVSFMVDDSDIIAFSCMGNLLPLLVLATKASKEQYPKRKIVLGGIGPSGVAEKLMAAFPHIDIIVKGEGEQTFPELLAVLEEGKPLDKISGLLVRDENTKFHVNKPVKRIRNLGDLPLPAYDMVNMASYETVGVQTARGCPFPCAFCDVSAYWGRTTSYRPLEQVMDEMKLLEKRYGFDKVTILDDTFILNPKRVSDFCSAYLRRGLTIRWSVYCRVDLLTEEMIDSFARAGCYRVFLGIESGSENVLRKISKPMDQNRLVRLVKKLSKLFITRANLIWGFPFETMEDLRETVHLLLYLRDVGCDVSLALLSPLPLSRLYNERKYSLVLRENLQSSVVSSRFYSPNGRTIVDGKSNELVELIREYPEIFPGFYMFTDNLFKEKLDYLVAHGLEIEKLVRQ